MFSQKSTGISTYPKVLVADAHRQAELIEDITGHFVANMLIAQFVDLLPARMESPSGFAMARAQGDG